MPRVSSGLRRYLYLVCLYLLGMMKHRARSSTCVPDTTLSGHRFPHWLLDYPIYNPLGGR